MAEEFGRGRVIASGALVCDDATLEGNVTIGSGTVVHPRCSILARGGSIEIGPDCVIEEQVVIETSGDADMKIGAMNLFEVGARVEASRIGECNVMEPKSKAGPGVVLGDGCVVGATSFVEAGGGAIRDDTVIYRGPDGRLHTRIQPRSKARHTMQITRYLDILRSPESRCCILNFHNCLGTSSS